MSQESVEFVRRSLDAYAQQGVEAVLPFLDQGIVIVDPDLPGGGTFEGHDDFLAFTGQVLVERGSADRADAAHRSARGILGGR